MVSRVKSSIPPMGLVDVKWDDIKADVLVTQNDHIVNKKCYRDSTIEELISLYKNKCAVCERDRGIELQVDHFRPQKARTYTKNPQYNNPGYYWLTYEWSNLIPLCSKCNQEKSNKFPLAVSGNRISSHLNTQSLNPFSPYDINWLKSVEIPLILNPETETNISKHFIFDKNGKMRGRTNFGNETILVFKLNRRDLRRKRIGIRNIIVDEIILSFDRFLEHRNNSRLKGSLETIFNRIVQGTYVDHELSLFYTFIFKYFDYFIGTKLITVLRAKTLDYFIEYKEENKLK